jgi:hypothetical protein
MIWRTYVLQDWSVPPLSGAWILPSADGEVATSDWHWARSAHWLLHSHTSWCHLPFLQPQHWNGSSPLSWPCSVTHLRCTLFLWPGLQLHSDSQQIDPVLCWDPRILSLPLVLWDTFYYEILAHAFIFFIYIVFNCTNTKAYFNVEKVKIWELFSDIMKLGIVICTVLGLKIFIYEL